MAFILKDILKERGWGRCSGSQARLGMPALATGRRRVVVAVRSMQRMILK